MNTASVLASVVVNAGYIEMDKPQYKDCPRCGYPNEIDEEVCTYCRKELNGE